MQNATTEPLYLDDAVVITRKEYERLCKLDIADKIFIAKKEIAEGKTHTHDEVFQSLNKILAED
ncbi:MAG: hypothetical protein FWC82_02550 [Firmicutes bacterium]|nr:hypothetical protein [Bacillota bacterium]